MEIGNARGGAGLGGSNGYFGFEQVELEMPIDIHMKMSRKWMNT